MTITLRFPSSRKPVCPYDHNSPSHATSESAIRQPVTKRVIQRLQRASILEVAAFAPPVAAVVARTARVYRDQALHPATTARPVCCRLQLLTVPRTSESLSR